MASTRRSKRSFAILCVVACLAFANDSKASGSHRWIVVRNVAPVRDDDAFRSTSEIKNKRAALDARDVVMAHRQMDRFRIKHTSGADVAAS